MVQTIGNQTGLIARRNRKVKEIRGEAGALHLSECIAHSMAVPINYLKQDIARLSYEFDRSVKHRMLGEYGKSEKLKRITSLLENLKNHSNIISELIDNLQQRSWISPKTGDSTNLNKIVIRWKEQIESHSSYNPNVRIALLLNHAIPQLDMQESECFQIVHNLAINSLEELDGIEQGRLVLKTDLIGASLLFEVNDNGRGIPEKIADKIFKPFYSNKQSLSTKTRHLGLGLYTTAQIVEANGGRIEFDSKPQKKTTFRIFLPIEKSRTLSERDARLVKE
ncbi:MAG: hypothetical protein KAX38_02485 [Candidatus Krumholzibacteria bacterium]|nr:hypothetical protein [Candidatus Krumholzibacteria bacterium]